MTAGGVAVFVVFGLNGAMSASWAARMPAFSEQLRAGPAAIGLALLVMTASMLASASVSGRLVERLGSRAVMVGSTLTFCLGLSVLGMTTSVLWFGAVLAVLGASSGALDVAMNVAGVGVERQLEKPIMPVLHAGYSFGGLIGSAAAGLAAGHHISPREHLPVAAIVMAVILAAVVRGLPRSAPRNGRPARTPREAPVRRPVLWLLAMVALVSAVAEGGSSDWSALLLVTAHGVGQGSAALAFSVFSLVMALTRLAGGWLQQRLGGVRMLALGGLVAAVGLVSAATVPIPWLAFAGFGLAGAGLAGAFPIALGLAGEAGRREDGTGGEREVAFVTAIAYLGFVGGPPVIGGIAQATSLSVSFIVVGILVALVVPAALGASRARDRELTVAEPAQDRGLLS